VVFTLQIVIGLKGEKMLIERFLKSGREFLGCNLPIMCGAMTWISDPKLVSAVGRAGGFGLLAGGNAPVDVLRDQINETRSMTDHPFGVNIITLAPAYKEHLDLDEKRTANKSPTDERPHKASQK